MKKLFTILSLLFVVNVTFAAITFTPTAIDTGHCETSYTCKVTATGGKAPYTYSISVGTLPSGLTIDKKTGRIAGIIHLQRDTSITFTVRAVDALSASGTKSYTMYITNSMMTWSEIVAAWSKMPNTYPTYTDVYNTYRLSTNNIMYSGTNTAYLPYSNSISTPSGNATYTVGTSTFPNIVLTATKGSKVSRIKLDSTKVSIESRDSVKFTSAKINITLSSLPTDSAGLTRGTLYRSGRNIYIKQ